MDLRVDTTKEIRQILVPGLLKNTTLNYPNYLLPCKACFLVKF